MNAPKQEQEDGKPSENMPAIFEDQPVMNCIIFVSSKSHKEFERRIQENDGDYSFLIGYEFDTVPLSHGTMPIEFGIIGFPEVVFEKKENKFVIKGTQSPQQDTINPVFASGIHRGHSILNIGDEVKL